MASKAQLANWAAMRAAAKACKTKSHKRAGKHGKSEFNRCVSAHIKGR